MSAPATPISVTVPVGQAIDHVKRLLFRPFDLGKWFTIGFCAWLADLGQRGSFGSGFNYSRGPRGLGEVREALDRAREYVAGNLSWLLPVIIGAVAVMFILWLVLLWLSSRGRFMFLHCVALNRAEVAEPWHRFARHGNSLFGFRVVLGLIGLVPMLVLCGLLGMLVWRIIQSGEAGPASYVTIAGLVLGLGFLGIVFVILGKFTTDFVVPIMFLRGSSCLAAWQEFLRLLSANFGRLLLYLLFSILLSMAIGMVILAVVLVTCCLAGCLMAIPYLGTVLLLPVLAFSRAYSIYYLAQYGLDYDVLPPAVAPPAP